MRSHDDVVRHLRNLNDALFDQLREVEDAAEKLENQDVKTRYRMLTQLFGVDKYTSMSPTERDDEWARVCEVYQTRVYFCEDKA